MAVKVTNRQYSEIYTQGKTDWLLGNVGDWQKLNIDVEVGIELFASQSQPVSIDYVNNLFRLSGGLKWGDFGFDNGMTVTFSYKFQKDTTGDGDFDEETIIQQSYTIQNVSQNIMEVDGTIDAQDFETVPTNFGTRRIIEVHFFVDQDTEGCKIKYTHLTNIDSQAEILRSVIDNTETEFVYPDLKNVIVGQWVDMEAVGMQSGMSIRKVRVRKTSDNANEVFATYDIPQSQDRQLRIVDEPFQDPEFETGRSIIASLQQSLTDYQSVTSDALVPTSGSTAGGSSFSSITQAQCFLFDADSAYSQQAYFNVNIRPTATQSLTPGNNFLRLTLLRFTNGSSFDLVSNTTLREWPDVQSLVNESLNFNGIINLDVNASDSYALIVEFWQPGPYNDTNRTMNYVIESGLIQLSQKDSTFTSGLKRKYEFEIEFMISSLFDSITNFEENQLPQYLQGDQSLTDNFDIQFLPEWNNPNVKVANDLQLTSRLGNTGWFNENFNQLPNDFQLESVTYFDENGNQTDSLDFSSATKVKAVITGVPNLNTNTELGFGFAWVPLNEEDYREKETPFYRNAFVSSGDTENGFSLDQLYTNTFPGAGIGGGSLDSSNIKFTNQNGKIIFEATFTPNSSFANQFNAKNEDDRNYILWVSVADSALGRNFSDRVSLLIDFNQLTRNIPPAGEYPYIDNAFIEHPYSETFAGTPGYEGLIQDDILCRLPIRIPKDGSIIFQSIVYGVEAFNLAENRSFELERFQIDLSQYPTDSNGSQQFNFDDVRGFKLNDGNNKNWVQMKRNSSLDTTDFFGYLGYFATKLRWEDWILNQQAPGDFYKDGELNNGLNNDWYQYQDTQGWSLRFFTEIVTVESGQLKEYKNRWNITLIDYDQNANLNVTHEYYRDSDNTLLNVGTDPGTGRPLGAVLSNEATRIEIEFEITDSGTWVAANTYGVVTIEIDLGAGRFEQWQLSSVWDRESDNPLKPVTGETNLKLEVDGTNKFAKLTCLIDPDLLPDAPRYRVTGRIGCFDDSGTPFSPGLYEFRYEDTYE